MFARMAKVSVKNVSKIYPGDELAIPEPFECALGFDDGHGIAPLHEAALRAGEARLPAALDCRELGAAVRAIAIIRVRHD